MIDWSDCPAVERKAEQCSGDWVFRGTRIPVAALFEHFESGAPIGIFIEWFPGVTLAQVQLVLAQIARSALTVQVDDGRPGTEAGDLRSVDDTRPDASDADPIVAGVHSIRTAVFAAAGGDLARICTTLRAIEAAERAAGREIID
jgi:uncharacterized protein (DUF433 family)